MSSRIYHPSYVQNTLLVEYTFSVVANGTNPALGEGDPNSAYVTLTRTGVGTIVVTTKDAFPGFVAASPGLITATPSTTMAVGLSNLTKNANNTWSITVTTTTSGTASDFATGNYVGLYLAFRNSSVNP